jgi:hypothetical protein
MVRSVYRDPNGHGISRCATRHSSEGDVKLRGGQLTIVPSSMTSHYSRRSEASRIETVSQSPVQYLSVTPQCAENPTALSAVDTQKSGHDGPSAPDPITNGALHLQNNHEQTATLDGLEKVMKVTTCRTPDCIGKAVHRRRCVAVILYLPNNALIYPRS